MSRRDPDWRDEAAASLAAESVSYLDLQDPAILMLDHRSEVARALEALGLSHRRWLRRAVGNAEADPWPTGGPFGAALLRLPKAKEEQEMALHAALGRLVPGGSLVAYGANDEGARSVKGLLEPMGVEAHTVATGGHCRVLSATRPGRIPGLKAEPEDWRVEGEPPVSELEGPWISYPGVFAHGRLDEGTALLLEHLPELPDGARVLDFGCGSGVVGAVALRRADDIRADLLDVDALALRAARENVPGGSTLLGDGLDAARGTSYDAILSNPPYHEGKAQTLRILRALARSAPGLLRPGGSLTLVTQTRLPTERLLEESFSLVRPRPHQGPYRVWEARLS